MKDNNHYVRDEEHHQNAMNDCVSALYLYIQSRLSTLKLQVVSLCEAEGFEVPFEEDECDIELVGYEHDLCTAL